MTRLVALFALLAACASNDRVPTSDTEYDDLAVSLAATIRTSSGHGDLVALGDVVALAGGAALPGFTLDGTGHHSERAGLDYRYAIACRDDAGPLDACTNATFAEAAASFGGTLALPYLDLAIERDGQWSLAIAADRTTLHGDGRMIYTTTIASPDRATSTYELQYAATYEGLVVEHGASRPSAGSVHYAIAADVTRVTPNRKTSRELEANAALTFDGGDRARLVIDETREYEIDLATGALVGR